MADKMDRGLDEIIAETRSSGSRNRRGGGGDRRRDRIESPRDGVRKAFAEEALCPGVGANPPIARGHPRAAKLRVENIHYDLTEEDLDELFARIGPVVRLQLLFDRAGRSEGRAYVTYESMDDAQEAIRQFDGANANGQPIRLNLVPSGPARNPFDTAVMPGRPLSERVSIPGRQTRSVSPRRRYDEDDAARKGIDRYIPGSGSRSRSPAPRYSRGGRRPGLRREVGAREQQGYQSARGGGRTHTRTRKTQDELDADMADYFGAGASTTTTTAVGPDDVDMIE
ncbi:hypothetical protein DCS_05268 [Drechmeria coniospora]|uniref:RRM domain-containing protein n=1 Tax=Drechmeria coniospora TaxID=98403 RepID=A0A151GMB6_DRECN|nr:hypothetical protein DCS_05268 [Drechmeria coniospora]KYK58255.1 hypothetical protein DCS_05268 [Drechmeria coniospora]